MQTGCFRAEQCATEKQLQERMEALDAEAPWSHLKPAAQPGCERTTHCCTCQGQPESPQPHIPGGEPVRCGGGGPGVSGS